MLVSTFREMTHFVLNHRPLVFARATIEPLLAVIMDITLQDSGMGSWALTLLNVLLFLFSAFVVKLSRKYQPRILTLLGMKRLTAVGTSPPGAFSL
jgi:hypothetical protein